MLRQETFDTSIPTALCACFVGNEELIKILFTCGLLCVPQVNGSVTVTSANEMGHQNRLVDLPYHFFDRPVNEVTFSILSVSLSNKSNNEIDMKCSI